MAAPSHHPARRPAITFGSGIDKSVNTVHAANVVHMSKREQNRRERLAAITEAAMQMVLDEGLEGLTTHKLAKKLGLAVGALYRYFPSKAALIAELERRVLAAYAERLGAAVQRARRRLETLDPPADAQLTALHHLAEIATDYAEFARQSPERFHVISSVMAIPRNIMDDAEGKSVLAETAKLMQQVSRLFMAAEEVGALDPGNPIERGMLYWSGIRAVVQMTKLHRFAPSLVPAQGLVDPMVRTMLVGWGADEDVVLTAIELSHAPAPRADHDA